MFKLFNELDIVVDVTRIESVTVNDNIEYPCVVVIMKSGGTHRYQPTSKDKSAVRANYDRIIKAWHGDYDQVLYG